MRFSCTRAIACRLTDLTIPASLDERRGTLRLVRSAIPAATGRRKTAEVLSIIVPKSVSWRSAGMGARSHRQRRSDPRRHQEWFCRNARVALEAEGTLPRVRHRPMILRLEILQNAVDDLRRLGWLDGADHRVAAALLDAVAELVERAICLEATAILTARPVRPIAASSPWGRNSARVTRHGFLYHRPISVACPSAPFPHRDISEACPCRRRSQRPGAAAPLRSVRAMPHLRLQRGALVEPRLDLLDAHVLELVDDLVLD